MGGLALLRVAMLVGGLKGPAWALYGGMAAVAALGVACVGLGVRQYVAKKPERPRFQSRRRPPPGA
jgi:predicted phage tail protein